MLPAGGAAVPGAGGGAAVQRAAAVGQRAAGHARRARLRAQLHDGLRTTHEPLGEILQHCRCYLGQDSLQI